MSGSREAKLLTELAETQDQRSSLLATNYDLRKERDRLTDELAEARALAGEAFMALTCIEETCIRFNDLRGRLHEFYSTSDQPTAGAE